VALSVYVLHMLLLVVAGALLQHQAVLPAFAAVCTFTASTAALAMAWRSRFARGPVEMLMHLVWDAMEATLGRASQSPSRPRNAPEREPHGSAAAPQS
jgi:uncharacterized membrane protein YeiB